MTKSEQDYYRYANSFRNKRKFPILWVDEEFKEYPLDPANWVISSYGRVFNIPGNFFITPCYNKGYLKAKIGGHFIGVHRAVAYTFLTNSPYYGLVVNHINGIKDDNRVCNLEWCTSKMNSEHAVRTGLFHTCEDHPLSTFTNDQVIKISNLLVEGKSVNEIIDIMGLPKNRSTHRNIVLIADKKNYTKITENFDFSNANIKRNRSISEGIKQDLCKLLAEGYYSREIAAILGIPFNRELVARLSDIKHGKSYREIYQQYLNMNN